MSTTYTPAPAELTGILNDGNLTDVQKVARLREIVSQIKPDTCDAEKVYRVRVSGGEAARLGWRGSDRDQHWAVQTDQGGMTWYSDGAVTVLGEAGADADAPQFKVGDTFHTVGALRTAVSDYITAHPAGVKIKDRDGDLGRVCRNSHDEIICRGSACMEERYAPFTIVGLAPETDC